MKNTKKPVSRTTRTVVMDLPEFKSEKQEAEFWDANPDLITAAMRAAYSTRKRSQAISIRVPVDDLARIKTLAARKGIGYQTMAKVLLHEAVAREWVTQS
jgi:predicted DNA binding CopG/RHH family protein